jgi:hypothetical protein
MAVAVRAALPAMAALLPKVRACLDLCLAIACIPRVRYFAAKCSERNSLKGLPANFLAIIHIFQRRRQ